MVAHFAVVQYINDKSSNVVFILTVEITFTYSLFIDRNH